MFNSRRLISLISPNYMQDIERDLTCDTKQVFPRIMQRLLYTLSYDRKVS